MIMIIRRFSSVLICLIMILPIIGCSGSEKDEIILAEIDGNYNSNGDMLIWLTTEGRNGYKMGFPFNMVRITFSPDDKKSSLYATIWFNNLKNAYQVDIEISTFDELRLWNEAFREKKPKILYRKY